MHQLLRRTALILASTLALRAGVRPDEGMWPFPSVPLAAMRQTHGWAPDRAWLDHVRRSTVRFPAGTGAFVSRNGLVLTNQHVAKHWIEHASGRKRDLLGDGYVAAGTEQEVPLPGLTLQVLEYMEDVTPEVSRAMAAAPQGERLKARRITFARLCKAAQERTGLACESVVFHQGGQFWIHGYRRFNDVRLVFVPEHQVAYFGGDPDNFTFPRHAMDLCLLRVYDQGLPYRTPNFLSWSREGIRNGDLTLVSGFPGKTLRHQTMDQMRFSRDVALPFRLRELRHLDTVLQTFARDHADHARTVRVMLQTVHNSEKRMEAWLRGLKDPVAMGRLEREERDFAQKLRRLPAEQRPDGAAIRRALQAQKKGYARLELVDTGNSVLLEHALQLVRLGDELRKPSEERLPDYQDACLPEIRENLLRPVPVDMELEAALLRHHLARLTAVLGARHPFTQVLARTDLAAALRDTRLQDPEFRAELLAKGPAALRATRDPLMELVRGMDPHFRSVRSWADEHINAPLTEHLGRLARARFLLAPGGYPDANRTLRLSYGPVAPFPRRDKQVHPFTTLAGMLDLADGWSGQPGDNPWALPGRWVQERSQLDGQVPLNFAHAVDAVGGSSGSPVVDRHGDLVGLLFDGNLASLIGNYYYDGTANRAISLDVRAMREVLAKVYGASHLLTELDLPPWSREQDPETTKP